MAAMTSAKLIATTFGQGLPRWPMAAEFRDEHGVAAHVGYGPKSIKFAWPRAPLDVIGVGMVCTREDRRREGLATGLMHAVMGDAKVPVVLFTGIPLFYARLRFAPWFRLNSEAMYWCPPSMNECAPFWQMDVEDEQKW